MVDGDGSLAISTPMALGDASGAALVVNREGFHDAEEQCERRGIQRGVGGQRKRNTRNKLGRLRSGFDQFRLRESLMGGPACEPHLE